MVLRCVRSREGWVSCALVLSDCLNELGSQAVGVTEEGALETRVKATIDLLERESLLEATLMEGIRRVRTRPEL